MTHRTRARGLYALAAAAGVAAVVSAAAPLPAQDGPKPAGDKPKRTIADEANKVIGDEINDKQKASVEKGLAWLSKRRKETTNFAQQGYANHAGITALAGLAFMQNGNLPGRGKYGEDVQAILDYVLASCTRSGLITSDASNGPMYGHGFATLFLGEVYGMTGDESVK
ncbi:MAG TPA: hypothetical protein VF796_04230, partial [Humisphaera sp.]